jgi:hypothetical protein
LLNHAGAAAAFDRRRSEVAHAVVIEVTDREVGAELIVRRSDREDGVRRVQRNRNRIREIGRERLEMNRESEQKRIIRNRQWEREYAARRQVRQRQREPETGEIEVELAAVGSAENERRIDESERQEQGSRLAGSPFHFDRRNRADSARAVKRQCRPGLRQ